MDSSFLAADSHHDSRRAVVHDHRHPSEFSVDEGSQSFVRASSARNSSNPQLSFSFQDTSQYLPRRPNVSTVKDPLSADMLNRSHAQKPSSPMSDDRFMASRAQYESRLASLTDRLRSTYHRIQHDEVIQAMKQDPSTVAFVQARMREIVDDSLAREREAYIERLSESHATREAEWTRSQHEWQATEMRMQQSVKGLEERCELLEHTLTAERADRARVDSELNSVQTALRDLLAKQGNSVHFTPHELVQLQSGLEEKEVQLRDRVKQIEFLTAQLDSCQRKELELSTLVQKLKHDLAIRDEQIVESKQKAKRYQKEMLRMEKQLQHQQHDKQALEHKYMTVGERFETLIGLEEKERSEAAQNLKRKVHKYKTILSEQRKLNQVLESDFSRIKLQNEQLEKTLFQREEEIRSLKAAPKSDYVETQFKMIQKQYELKITDLEADNTALVQRLRETESKFTDIHKDCISRSQHSQAIQEKLSILEAQHSADLRSIQARQDSEVNSRTREWEEKKQKEFTSAMLQIRANVKSLESSLEEQISIRKDSEDQLSKEKETHMRLRAELEEIDRGKKVLLSHLEEAARHIARLKSMVEEEQRKRKTADLLREEFEIRLKETEDRVKVLQQQLDRSREEYHAFRESHSTFSSAAEQQAHRIHMLELQVQEKSSQLNQAEVERNKLLESLRDSMSRITQEVHMARKEEASKMDREVLAHVDTKTKLTQAESTIQQLTADLDRQQQRFTELKIRLSDSEKEVVRLRAAWSQLESEKNHTGWELQSERERYQRMRLAREETNRRLIQLLNHRTSRLRDEKQLLVEVVAESFEQLNKDANRCLAAFAVKAQQVELSAVESQRTAVAKATESLQRHFAALQADNEMQFKVDLTKSVQQMEARLQEKDNDIDLCKQRESALMQQLNRVRDELEDCQKELLSAKHILQSKESDIHNLITVSKQERASSQLTVASLESQLKQVEEQFNRQQEQTNLAHSQLKIQESIRLNCESTIKLVSEMYSVPEEISSGLFSTNSDHFNFCQKILRQSMQEFVQSQTVLAVEEALQPVKTNLKEKITVEEVLRTEISVLKKQVEDLQEREQMEQEEVSRLQTQLESAEGRFESLNQEYRSKTVEWQAEIEAVQNEGQRLIDLNREESIVPFKEELRKVQVEVKSLKQQYQEDVNMHIQEKAELTQDLTRSRSLIEEKLSKINSLENECRELRRQLAAESDSVNQVTAELERRMKELKNVNELLEKNQEANRVKSRTATQLELEHEQLKETIRKLSDELTKRDEVLKKRDKEVNRLTSELTQREESIRQEVAEMQRKYEQLKQRHESLKNREEEMENTLKEKQNASAMEIKSLTRKLEEARQRAEQEAQRFKQSQINVERVEEQLRNHKTLVESLTRENEDRKREVEKLRRRGAELKELIEKREREMHAKDVERDFLATNKDKEIHDLHELLSRSYSSVSLDGIRKSNKLDAETEQLNKLVRNRLANQEDKTQLRRSFSSSRGHEEPLNSTTVNT